MDIYGHLWTMELTANSCSAFAAAAPPLPPFDLLANLAEFPRSAREELQQGTHHVEVR
jgi:hypothetical protein